VLRAPEGDVGKLYGAMLTPHMFLIGLDGRVFYMGGIDSIASTDVDDIPEARQYVKLALAEAMAGKPVTDASTKPYGCSVKYD